MFRIIRRYYYQLRALRYRKQYEQAFADLIKEWEADRGNTDLR